MQNEASNWTSSLATMRRGAYNQGQAFQQEMRIWAFRVILLLSRCRVLSNQLRHSRIISVWKDAFRRYWLAQHSKREDAKWLKRVAEAWDQTAVAIEASASKLETCLVSTHRKGAGALMLISGLHTATFGLFLERLLLQWRSHTWVLPRYAKNSTIKKHGMEQAHSVATAALPAALNEMANLRRELASAQNVIKRLEGHTGRRNMSFYHNRSQDVQNESSANKKLPDVNEVSRSMHGSGISRPVNNPLRAELLRNSSRDNHIESSPYIEARGSTAMRGPATLEDLSEQYPELMDLGLRQSLPHVSSTIHSPLPSISHSGLHAVASPYGLRTSGFVVSNTMADR